MTNDTRPHRLRFTGVTGLYRLRPIRGAAPMKGQSRRMSLVESITNVVVGLLVSVLFLELVLPLWGVQLAVSSNVVISLLFTVVSLLRSYLLRRLFESFRG